MTDQARAARVEAIFARAAAVHEAVGRAGADVLVQVVDALAGSFAAGGKALIFGNGGSAADAGHFAAELVCRFQRERRGLPAIALTTDSAVVTAIGNDYGFDRVFARQVEALGAPGDVAIGISTSGRSANVIAALEAAAAKGVTTVAMTGRDGGPLGRMADIHVNVPDEVTARVQEVQRTQIHVICELIEDGL
jgi:D-sedoheptulose 7-phosphate isomerase